MKRLLLFVAAVMVMWSSSAFAANSSVHGVYLAPKFTVSVLHTRGTLDLAASSWGPRRVFGARAGGALALGYDFWRKFKVPFRLELEPLKVFQKRRPSRCSGCVFLFGQR